jgi:hypothetical protein
MQTIFLYYKGKVVEQGMYFNIQDSLCQLVSINVEKLSINVSTSTSSTRENKEIEYNDLPLDFEFYIFTQRSKISRKPKQT